MQGKIAIEEHFILPGTMGYADRYFELPLWKGYSDTVKGIMDRYTRQMEENGLDIMVLSLKSSSIQGIPDRKRAVEAAILANDLMAEAIQRHGKGFRGLAALPMQDVDGAIRELHRAVEELGYPGVIVNGFSQVDTLENAVYLDDPRYLPFWEELEKLDVPLYLHPRDTLPADLGPMRGHPWLEGAAWSFGVETATHALRLMCAGVFDRFPNLKLVLGHLGETLPYCIWRCENHIKRNPRGIPAPTRRPLPEYLQRNVWLTTSGQFHTPSLLAAMMEVGADRILFAADTPFEDLSLACGWLDTCPISEGDRQRIGRQNAVDLFRFRDL